MSVDAAKYVEKARLLAEPLAEKMGCGVVDVEYVKEGGEWRLCVYIDKSGGVFIEDCERFSRAFSDALDEADFIASSYTLVVSSPGIDRPLKTDQDFARHAGELVEAWYSKDEKRRRKAAGVKGGDYEEGVLARCEGGVLKLETGDGKIAEFSCDKFAYIKRAVRF